MSTTKKFKPVNDSAPASSLLGSVWDSLFGLADDTRAELHKQTTALIHFVEGALQGATGYATNLSDRSDHVAREALLAAHASGRTLALGTRAAGHSVVTSYRQGAAKMVSTTRDSARTLADRASATARVAIAPSSTAKAA